MNHLLIRWHILVCISGFESTRLGTKTDDSSHNIYIITREILKPILDALCLFKANHYFYLCYMNLKPLLLVWWKLNDPSKFRELLYKVNFFKQHTKIC